MILICGIPSEAPLAMVREALCKLDVPHTIFNQRQFLRMAMDFDVSNGRIRGCLSIAGQEINLQDITGVYTRVMDDQSLPELKHEPENSLLRQHSRALHDTLMRWSEITPARVVNRIAPMGSNSSKPYQAQLIQAYGFCVPETLITNEPAEVIAFRKKYGRIIYKSISGIRSIVQTLDNDDLDRLEQIRWCPTQFQAYVPGTDVRVHTIGQQVFATAINADGATDYRYAAQQNGQQADLIEISLPDDLSQRCLDLAAGLGLAFAGIDLKLTSDGEVYCFEVNPCPGYSYYEANTGQPIAKAVASYLAGMN